MNLIGNNLWERNKLRKLVTVAQVQDQIAYCHHGRVVAATTSELNKWERKLLFLDKLKRQREQEAQP